MKSRMSEDRPGLTGCEYKKGTARKWPPIKAVRDIAFKCGGINTAFADMVGISESLVRKHRAMDPKVEQIFQDAEARTNGLVSRRVLLAALKGEAWACCFWLKCRAGWQERPSREVESTDARERREDRDAMVKSALENPESRKAASALIASFYKRPPVPEGNPAGKEKAN